MQMKSKIKGHGFNTVMLPAPNAMGGQGGFIFYINGIYNGSTLNVEYEVPCTINMDYSPYLDAFYKKLLR